MRIDTFSSAFNRGGGRSHLALCLVLVVVVARERRRKEKALFFPLSLSLPRFPFSPFFSFLRYDDSNCYNPSSLRGWRPAFDALPRLSLSFFNPPSLPFFSFASFFLFFSLLFRASHSKGAFAERARFLFRRFPSFGEGTFRCVFLSLARAERAPKAGASFFFPPCSPPQKGALGGGAERSRR